MVIPDLGSNNSDDNNDGNQGLDWWNRREQKLHYAEYQINSFTKVLVGVRPNYGGTTPEFYKSVEGWINVSDRFVRHDKHVTNTWLPWNEGGIPSYETVYAVLKTLNYWINEQKLSKIYIHCDGGTHRAVTLFGMYLLAYHKEEAEKINNSYVLVNREHWSRPLEYARSYFKDIPAIEIFLDKLKDAKDDFNYGYGIEQFLKDDVGQEKIQAYLRERYFLRDLPYVWSMTKLSVVWFFKGNYAKLSNFVHKKLNTKRGQHLKRMGF